MNEPAFLAAIAANPADGLTRRVYADWLDEHADPRGEYLRELCAAAGWAECPDRDTVTARLREMGRTLDDDWVAAVQKGCNWRTLFEVNALYGEDDDREVHPFLFGEPATEEQLAEAETSLGVKLPADIRSILTEFNGVELFEEQGSDQIYYPAAVMAGTAADFRSMEGAEGSNGEDFDKILFIGGWNGQADLWCYCLESV